MNQQPTEPILQHDGRVLVVHSIFPTIQGEGPFAGWPSVFVRLSGCQLQCLLCDTDYTSTNTPMPVADLVDEVMKSMGSSTLVVITGGEPHRQNLGPFVDKLLGELLEVQIETNGGLPSRIPKDLDGTYTTVCSPKTPKVVLENSVDAWKYTVRVGDPIGNDGLPFNALGYDYASTGKKIARPPRGTHPSNIHIQPVDEKDDQKNNDNAKLAAKICMEHGYTLSYQTHKELGLP